MYRGEGGRQGLRVGECVFSRIPLLIFKAYTPGTCTIAGRWICIFIYSLFLFVSCKVMLASSVTDERRALTKLRTH